MARLFVAINFCEDTKKKLCDGINYLRSNSRTLSPSHKNNLHLTLAFIGETSKIRTATAALDSIDASAFELETGGFGQFKGRGGSICFVKAYDREHRLISLAEAVRTELLSKGFEIDTKPFKPHITLCREFIPSEAFNEDELVSIVGHSRELITKISLMKSERISGRLTYTEIFAKRLK